METDPKRMEKLSKTIFKEVYPLISSQIIKKCGIKDGICIDIGSGSGALAIAISKLSNFKIYSLDVSAKMNQIALQNIENEGLANKISPLIADAHQLPFSDEFADLIISRGSMFFWKNKEQCFREIYRVLKPSGFAYIGGGFGSAELKDKVKEYNRNIKNGNYVKIPKIEVSNLQKIMKNAEIKNYDIINDNSGLWVLINKLNK